MALLVIGRTYGARYADKVDVLLWLRKHEVKSLNFIGTQSNSRFLVLCQLTNKNVTPAWKFHLPVMTKLSTSKVLLGMCMHHLTIEFLNLRPARLDSHWRRFSTLGLFSVWYTQKLILLCLRPPVFSAISDLYFVPSNVIF